MRVVVVSGAAGVVVVEVFPLVVVEGLRVTLGAGVGTGVGFDLGRLRRRERQPILRFWWFGWEVR
jgi:hypothetical protein